MAELLLLENPVDITILATINLGVAMTILALVYYIIRPRSRRVTTVYLAGEGEEVVSSISPSPLNLYWFFIKRFAKRIYGYLVEAMHTGNLMDWVDYMVSWYGILILVSILTLIAYTIMR
ncbi:MAG: sodium:proton antiporter [Thermoprotei archaeon]